MSELTRILETEKDKSYKSQTAEERYGKGGIQAWVTLQKYWFTDFWHFLKINKGRDISQEEAFNEFLKTGEHNCFEKAYRRSIPLINKAAEEGMLSYILSDKKKAGKLLVLH